MLTDDANSSRQGLHTAILPPVQDIFGSPPRRAKRDVIPGAQFLRGRDF
jgi:hypothetical protein